MHAYYNEFDPFAADWLEELIKDNLIAPGVVDRRSITEVNPNDLKDFTQCHFFAGIGGWSLSARLAGWPDDRPMWTGSPPCQPFSSAGSKQGRSDKRHLWPAFFNLIKKQKPTIIFGEQVTSAIQHGWFDELRHDMEAQEYATAMVVLPACGIGAPHKRERLYYVAHSHNQRQQANQKSGNGQIRENKRHDTWGRSHFVKCIDGKRRVVPIESTLYPLANGVSNRLDILRGTGNAIVPQVGAEVIRAYMEVVDAV